MKNFRSSKVSNQIAISLMSGLIIAAGLGIGLHLSAPINTEIKPKIHPSSQVEPHSEIHLRSSWSIDDFSPWWEKSLLLPPPPALETASLEVSSEDDNQPPDPPAAETLPLRLKEIFHSQQTKIAVFETRNSSPKEIVRLRPAEVFQQLTVLEIGIDKVLVKFKQQRLEIGIGE